MTTTDKIIKKGITRLGIVMMVCNFVGMMTYKLALPNYYFELFPVLVLIMFVISSIIVSVTAKAMEGSNATFVNVAMTTSILKLIILALVFLLYALFIKENLISFFVSLVVLYVIFTAFETTFRAKLNRYHDELNNK